MAETDAETASLHRAAISGESVPGDLSSELTMRCTIRGIRHQDGFGVELMERQQLPLSIKRALNARAIMSNSIPTGMDTSEQTPYCFWYPDVPSEDTLRQLLRHNSGKSMAYQVGRACAAGGYASLYKQLDLLPDVSIAEEARDSGASGSKEIYDSIVQQPCRYAVMDDYNRIVRDTPIPMAFLNGNTCTRSTLSRKKVIYNDYITSKHSLEPVLDITEDWNLDVDGVPVSLQPIDQEIFSLYTPLPLDLPNVDKDVLILMAAWSGNIDRYARLRRERMVLGERECVIRGIYHHTFFAKWCHLNLDSTFYKHVHARFVMNNDLSWVTDLTPDDQLPVIIWHPNLAQVTTYLELHRRKPGMEEQVAVALAKGGWFGHFSKLNPTPTANLVDAAFLCRDQRCSDFLWERESEFQDADLDPEYSGAGETYVLSSEFLTRDHSMLYRELSLYDLGVVCPFGTEGKEDCSHIGCISNVLMYVSATPRIQLSQEYKYIDLDTVYRDGPYVSPEDRKRLGCWPDPHRPPSGYRKGRDEPFSAGGRT
ncbi:hypothetical protein AK830_g1307 [Neonectria ditissima]|uniref:Uncharacterized protein n=1 Tax=Neonectria ditissima TaxID=78410 RepID=A0A0P7BF97_9HYPO|nr:hypothetical protein AK830_g1307 [Neonectria ditissima]